VVLQLLSARWAGAEEGSTAEDQVRAPEEELLVNEEVLLLGAGSGVDFGGALVSEEAEHPERLAVEGFDGAQQWDLVIERISGPGGKDAWDAQRCPVGMLHDEGGRGRVPCRVASGFEGLAQTAAGEGGGIGLALDEVLAGELCNGTAAGIGGDEAFVLFGCAAGQWLEPVSVVRGAALDCPFLHRQGNDIGDGGIELLALLDRCQKRAEDRLGKALLHDLEREDVLRKDLFDGNGGMGRDAVETPVLRRCNHVVVM
jgi:hypothetical protein